MKTRTTSLLIIAASTAAFAAAALVSEQAYAQCGLPGTPPCTGGGDRQRKPTPTPSPVPPTATSTTAQLALVIGGTPACTPDPADPTAVCLIPPHAGANPSSSGASLAQRPPNPNVPSPFGSILKGNGLILVLLIIAILLAIAIPTFLGARDSANARQNGDPLGGKLDSAEVEHTEVTWHDPNGD